MAAVGLPVWAVGVWADTVWADGVWASTSAVAVGGVVAMASNGAFEPPANAVQGTQANWMCQNGVWYIPSPRHAPWPRRRRDDR